MSKASWHERWQHNNIGFHADTLNPYLLDHWATLGVAAGARVFVPLCGKTIDMHYLAEQGFEVVGVELSAIAARDFFASSSLDPSVTHEGEFEVWRAGAITIYVGDFFSLSQAMIGDCAGFFDRAALIALPPEERRRYVRHLYTLLAPSATGLLVTLDYDQAQMSGPPFAVPLLEVETLCSDFFSLAPLTAPVDVLASEDKFRERGVTAMHERAFLLTRI